MGTRSAATLTETWDVPAPTGLLYLGIDGGGGSIWPPPFPRPRCATGPGSGRRCAVVTTSQGFRELTGWLGELGFPQDQIRIGLEPTGGWYGRTVAAWLERHGYRVDWLQNFAIHDRRHLMIGKPDQDRRPGRPPDRASALRAGAARSQGWLPPAPASEHGRGPNALPPNRCCRQPW
jgi:hypothetical protein